MNLIRFCILVGGIAMMAASARAQLPFFYPGATAFTPEISIVNSGSLLDAQATVSADRKYVTLNMRPQNSTLLALRSFTFQQGTSLGTVGDPPPSKNANGATAKDDPANAVRTSPSDILAHAKSQISILHREGMSRVGALKE